MFMEICNDINEFKSKFNKVFKDILEKMKNKLNEEL